MNIEELNRVPIENKVMAYKKLSNGKNELTYARKISDYAVVVNELETFNELPSTSYDTVLYFEPDKYRVIYAEGGRLGREDLLRRLDLCKISLPQESRDLDTFLEPRTTDANWYEKTIDITSKLEGVYKR